jgi:hypothetical protein
VKFSINGKVYDATDLESVKLRDILVFEQQTKDMGRAVTWGEVNQWADELDALGSDDERANHPGAPWLTAVTVWASRRIAGEDLTFGDAVDFPMSALRFIPDPEDHKPKANPTKARPTGSGRAGNSRPAAASG